MKKILALVLAATMLLGICLMAGCGEKPVDTTAGNTSAATTEAPSTTEGTTSTQTTPVDPGTDATTEATKPEATTEATTAGPVVPEDPMANWDGYTKLPGKEDVDFRGKEFVIAGEAGIDDRWESGKEIYSEDSAAIQVAVMNRNKTIETLYNCKIKGDISEDPGAKVTAEVTSGKHTIDMFTTKYAVMSIATAGSCYNLYSLGIDFSNDWWDQNYVNTFTIKNAAGTDTLYSMVGDFSLSAFAATHALMFNKKLYDTAIGQGLGYDIYQLVRDGKWTMDVFAEMVKAAAVENSGNSEFHYDEGDIMGWVKTAHATHGLHAASALPIVVNNAGVLSFAVENDAANWSTVVDKAIEIWAMPEGEDVGYVKVQEALSSGKALFASEVIDVLERMKDVQEESFGLVPYPKYSESQDRYAHYVDNHVFSYSVPTSVSEIEELGKFIEIYAAHSRKIVRTAWVETYAYEYCGDTDSAEMLDIILDSRTYDPGYLMFSALEGEVSQMISSGKNNITKWGSRRGRGVSKDIETYIKDISDNKA